MQLLAVVRAPRVLHLNLPEALRPKGGDAVGALRDEPHRRELARAIREHLLETLELVLQRKGLQPRECSAEPQVDLLAREHRV